MHAVVGKRLHGDRLASDRLGDIYIAIGLLVRGWGIGLLASG